jgi:peptidoglycan-N-acetylglucosamine deacetylase
VPPSFIISIDVEDWFQVENFKSQIHYDSWGKYELRVERNTHRLLDLLDTTRLKTASSRGAIHSNNNNGQTYRLSATFFFLGWLAERLPHLVKEIQARGHEIASHGYTHELCSNLSINHLRSDLLRSKQLLEDLTGTQVYGYRAPSFSIDNIILKLVEDCGYTYDASYNSFASHGRYGKLHTSAFQHKGIAYRISNTFYELPVSNWHLLSNPAKKNGHNSLPWGGGGYFRLIPSWIFQRGIRSIIQKQGAYHFYMHPWEIDPRQPRVHGLPRSYKFRHYINLQKTEAKLKKLITSFSQYHFFTCYDYLRTLTNQNTVS